MKRPGAPQEAYLVAEHRLGQVSPTFPPSEQHRESSCDRVVQVWSIKLNSWVTSSLKRNSEVDRTEVREKQKANKCYIWAQSKGAKARSKKDTETKTQQTDISFELKTTK